MPRHAPLTMPRAGQWASLAAVLVVVKLAWLAADHVPMLFLGDSASYLATAELGWIPPDRSFLYGFLLRPLALQPGSLLPLIVAQAACSVVAALVLARVLGGAFALPVRAAFAAAVVWAALEPLALLYERYVMTEAFALAGFAAFTAFALRYVEGRRWRDLVLAHVAATLVVALRTMFVPVALAFAVLLPVLAWARRADAWWRPFVLALAVSLAAVLVLHSGYKAVHAAVGGTAAYSRADGYFLLAAWAPKVRVEDFDDPVLGARVVAGSECEHDNRFQREWQRWDPGCLVGVLERKVGDAARANAIARAAALRALRRDPLGIAHLAFVTWRDGLAPWRVREALAYDRNVQRYGAATVVLLRDRLGVADAAHLHARMTPAKRWHAASVPWIVLLGLTPLLALAALATVRAPQRRAMSLVVVLAACVAGATAIGATGPVPRYLHATAWLAMIPLTLLVAAVSVRRRGAPPAPAVR